MGEIRSEKGGRDLYVRWHLVLLKN